MASKRAIAIAQEAEKAERTAMYALAQSLEARVTELEKKLAELTADAPEPKPRKAKA
jgi:uncharacterized protein YceH (UPF0502 family)